MILPEDRPFIYEPEVYTDSRGVLFESYRQDHFDTLAGRVVRFVQDNHSTSVRGVLRGLHYQLTPAPQGKLVRVVSGSVFDVAVDLRRSSETFGQWTGYELSETNRRLMWVPPGFAHGFYVMSERADVVYKLTGYHNPDLARTVRWDDPEIGIDWPLSTDPVVSERDRNAPSLSDAEVYE